MEWSELRKGLDDLGAGIINGLSVAEGHEIAAWLLLLALDRRYSDELQRRRDALDLAYPAGIAWWKGLLADGRPAASAVVVVTFPRATAEATELRERRRQAEEARVAAEEAERVATERRLEDEKQRKAAERAAAFRYRRRTAVSFTWTLLVLYLGLALAASIVLMLLAGQDTFLKPSGEGDWGAAFYAMMSVAVVLARLCWVLDLILARSVGAMTSTVWLELIGLVLGIVALNSASSTSTTTEWTLLNNSFQAFTDDPGARWTYPMIGVALGHAVNVTITCVQNRD